MPTLDQQQVADLLNEHPRAGFESALRDATDAAILSCPGQVPLLGRIFPSPLKAKVPEIIALFWIVKMLTTAGGEATSDYRDA